MAVHRQTIRKVPSQLSLEDRLLTKKSARVFRKLKICKTPNQALASSQKASLNMLAARRSQSLGVLALVKFTIQINFTSQIGMSQLDQSNLEVYTRRPYW